MSQDDCYLLLFGKIIGQAIEDYRDMNRGADKYERRVQRILGKKTVNRTNKDAQIIKRFHDYTTAKHFLFSESGLEAMLKNIGFEAVDVGYLRGVANGERDYPNAIMGQF